MARRTARRDVDEFIAARSASLLRTACLLSGRREPAEELLQVALAEVWSTWQRGELGPDLTALRSMVRTHTRWWLRPRPRPSSGEPDAGDRPHDLVHALQRLPRRQRAALVLAEAAGLPLVDVAEALECSPATAARLVDRARSRFAPDDPAAALAVAAQAMLGEEAAGPAPGVTVARRIDEVGHRVDVRRVWRRTEALVSLLLATVVAVVLVAALSGRGDGAAPPPPRPRTVEPPPLLVGHQLPKVIGVNAVDYEYFRSEQSLPGRDYLRVAVLAQREPQALAWMSTAGPRGKVLLTVDGVTVGRGPSGRFESGLLLSARRAHLVTVTAKRFNASTRLGLAIYRWPSP